MLDQILAIINFMIEAFRHVWPYLLITIPIAVAVQMSGGAKYITRAFSASPTVAILLATAVGAFSPFCGCSVVPIVAALLIGGVPLAPVMAFWIASPSMDPEIFFLSVATLGWDLAIWRLVATLLLSLTAGFATHFVFQQGWLGQNILKTQQLTATQSSWALLKSGWYRLKQAVTVSPVLGFTGLNVGSPIATAGADVGANTSTSATLPHTLAQSPTSPTSKDEAPLPAEVGCNDSCSTPEVIPAGDSCSFKPATFRQRLWAETQDATLMVVKFMALAYFIEALIVLYVPSQWITGLLGPQNPLAILTAAFVGVPVYTTNLTALPLVGGLLTQGMNPGAALAFLIAGPTTTLPAMAAVWGLVTGRVFILYVAFSLIGAIVLGYIYSLIA